MIRKDLDTMNYVKNGLVIKIIFIAFLTILFVKPAELQSQPPDDEVAISDLSFFDTFISRRRTLFAKTEIIRFLNEYGQTEFDLNYKIPNNHLQFIETREGLVATLDIEFNIYKDNVLVSPNKFEYKAGALTTSIAQSEKHFVLDKISFTLDRTGFSADLKITDKNASTVYTEKIILDVLNKNTLISDIEISHGLSTDLNPALDKFQRGAYQFYVDPNPVLDSNNRDFFAYFQISNISAGEDSLYRFFEFIKIFKDSVKVWETEYNHTVEFMPYPVLRRIPLSSLEPGLYTLEVEIINPKHQNKEKKDRTFSVTKQYTYFTQRVFPDDDEEFELINYFIDNRQRRLWRGLNEDGRKRFIERFWTANNPNPNSDTNEFLDLIRQRVNEANWRFSYHRAGWRTDLGRIYIKLGSPDEIDKDVTKPDSRYSRKDYQIWRYNNLGRNYLFYDFQGNGNYRLIYSKNDTSETSDYNWKSYFEPDFDATRVEN